MMREKIVNNSRNLIVCDRDQHLVIPGCDGTKKLTEARDIFLTGVSLALKRRIEPATGATLPTRVWMYNQIADAPYQDLFPNKSKAREVLGLTEHQIIEFCRCHQRHLYLHGYGTIFVLKEVENFSYAVAHGSVDSLRMVIQAPRGRRCQYPGRRARLILPIQIN